MNKLLHPPDSKDNDLAEFCKANGIRQSRSGDSYYFKLNGFSYRISNHSEQYSNACSRNLNGKKVRRCYHRKRDPCISIIAPRSKVKEIYLQLKRKGDKE